MRLDPALLRAAGEVTLGMAALVIVVGVLGALRRPGAAATTLAGALGLALEFLLAGGLLRLAARPGLATLGVIALIVGVRQVIAAGLRYARFAAAGSPAS